MAEVRMTLAEYNEMKEELDLYKGILTSLSTPSLSSWDVEYYQKNPEYAMNLSSSTAPLTSAQRKVLISLVLEQVNACLSENEITGECKVDNDFSMHLVTISHRKEDEEDGTVRNEE